jgi:hypothetical protein
MIRIFIFNDDAVDLRVAVTDLNSNPPQDVTIPNGRINHGDPAVGVDVVPDGNGKGNIQWSAQNDDGSKTKSGQETPGAGDTVNVDVFGV